MKKSVILSAAKNAVGKVKDGYQYSLLHRTGEKAAARVEKWTSGSRILGFFSRDWKLERAWAESALCRAVSLPFRLAAGAGSAKRADRLNGEIGRSRILSAAVKGLGGLLDHSTRVYGLGLLTYTAVYGLLSNTGNGLKAALAFAAVVLILVDRPVKALFEGSLIMKLAADFFTAGGKDDGI